VNRGDAALPVYCDQADDPDHENTLATAVIRVGAESIERQIFDQAKTLPRFRLKKPAKAGLACGLETRPSGEHLAAWPIMSSGIQSGKGGLSHGTID
jgi:hypothetical protein